MPIADLKSLPPLERSSKSELFKPLKFGDFEVSHRIALAPLTRNRGKKSDKYEGTWSPWDIHTEYYTERATEGGMLISEALPISLQAVGKRMYGVPGIWTPEQMDGWKKVVSEVKKTGAVFIAQLFHGGRTAGHSHLTRACSSSATRIEEQLGGGSGDIPDEMSVEDIKRTIGDFVQCAKNAIECGFDGVEIHGGNGYLPDQFMHSNINKRTDEYGGSIENRNKFMIEMSEAVATAIGPEKFGLRLAPYGFFNETRGNERVEQWTALCDELADKGFAYIHFMEARYDEVMSQSSKLAALGLQMSSDFDMDGLPTIAPFREALGGVEGKTKVIVAGGYDTENIWDVVDSGKADLVAIGRYFTSNPDLVYRIKNGKELVKYNRPRFYVYPEGKPHDGYTDFSYHQDNIQDDDVVKMEKFIEHQKRGIVVAKCGWQLEQDGVQLGEIYV